MGGGGRPTKLGFLESVDPTGLNKGPDTFSETLCFPVI
jgi:hypothetical protein